MAERENTKARETARRMEAERLAPRVASVNKYMNEEGQSGLEKAKRAITGIATVPLSGLADAATRPFKTKRSDEELDELAREVAKGDKKMKKGGKVSSASSRADGCAQRGKTKGRMV